MYSNKENVNILTALLVAHHIDYAVVCPGSRNAPIVHNLVTCPDIECHPVTDERSAGFYALGMAQATGRPAVVCVTSGSALLNLLPAVAEAYYQHVPLVVISADRPTEWIDQLDGQTIPQPDALGRFVRKAVTLPILQPSSQIPHPSSNHWHCNRLVNEALLGCRQQGGGPVHINVPLDEPLYEFTVPELPQERFLSFAPSTCNRLSLSLCVEEFVAARRPMIIVGQLSLEKLMLEDFREIVSYAVVLNESLSIGCGGCHFDELLAAGKIPDDMKPDFLLYLGDMLVSKRMRHFLRSLPNIPMWQVSEDGQLRDTTMHFTGMIEGHPADVLSMLGQQLEKRKCHLHPSFVEWWDEQLAEEDDKLVTSNLSYSSSLAVKMLEEHIGDAGDCYTHYANSIAVRLANQYAAHYVYCNRGVNGIEGSLSTAAGFSLAVDEAVYCVIGDLSFFYDSNALWNQELRDNLRILLLNNGGGGIFEKFEGLKGSPARERFVMAQHKASAEGICRSYNICYRPAHNMEELLRGIDWLVSTLSIRPLLLEVFV
ncbi:MAG: 2-succinyl-5-enolpyruvyl-6-hydroxy-3-cyclohexene-1-carboxylic-acid synthase [Prevotella sp.]|nr:2-succinyl-5-enolpyruvyl-6-hydroxy-3-cyclohexene-1-carboxylic-acid synthase [Prevotella sp.]